MVVLLVAYTGKGTMVDVSLFLVIAPELKQSYIQWNRQRTLMFKFMHNLTCLTRLVNTSVVLDVKVFEISVAATAA